MTSEPVKPTVKQEPIEARLISAIVDAVMRYERWRANMAALKEQRRFSWRRKREAGKATEAAV